MEKKTKGERKRGREKIEIGVRIKETKELERGGI